MEDYSRIFKMKSQNGDLAFFNTVAVVVTYAFVVIFFFKQMSLISGTIITPGMYLDRFVDAIGVSTFTYTFTAALPMQTIAYGTPLFGVNVWMLVLNAVYIVLYGLFIPRGFALNIGLCLLTVILVLGMSYSITNTYRRLESGQANGHKIEREKNGEDGCVS